MKITTKFYLIQESTWIFFTFFRVILHRKIKQCSQPIWSYRIFFLINCYLHTPIRIRTKNCTNSNMTNESDNTKTNEVDASCDFREKNGKLEKKELCSQGNNSPSVSGLEQTDEDLAVMARKSSKHHKKWNRRMKIFFCCLGYKKNKVSSGIVVLLIIIIRQERRSYSHTLHF